MPGTGSTDAGVVKAALPLSMATFTLANTNAISDMVMEDMNGLMVASMTAVFDVTIETVLEPTVGQMDPCTRVNSSMAIDTAREHINSRTVRFTRVNGRMGNTTDKENAFGLMEEPIVVIGKKEKHMGMEWNIVLMEPFDMKGSGRKIDPFDPN
jgi:hypothetical protein